MLPLLWLKVIGGVLAGVVTFAAGFLPRLKVIRGGLILELLNVRPPYLVPTRPPENLPIAAPIVLLTHH